MTANKVRACFQEIRDLGHFCPPLAQQMRIVVVSGSWIREFFRLVVGANGGKAANETGQFLEVS
jgi:hypothetical protein